jgi:hypothetical protein
MERIFEQGNDMKIKPRIASTTWIALCALLYPLARAQESPSLNLLDKLLELPRQVSVHQFSSHNKKGLNGDENWPLYKDQNGDDVIFDAAGPGCVKSMWGTNFDAGGVLKFYFDGEYAGC